MPQILGCTILAHNVWLTAMAALVCVVGSFTLLRLFDRARRAKGAERRGWQFLATLTAGASIWSTHFVGMLAYDPGAPFGLDVNLTIASSLIASAGAGFGVVLASEREPRWRAAFGGAVLGVSISAMHFCGMFAYRVMGLLSWDEPLIVIAVAFATIFGAASLHLAAHGRRAQREWAAPLLLIAAIVGMHFTGMAALRITPLIIGVAETNRDAEVALAFAVVGMTLLIVGAGLSSYLIDRAARADSLGKLRDMALHDPLTGLSNRADFARRLSGMLDDAESGGASVALLAIDLNGFKEVNDLHGHLTGDLVLKCFANRLQAALEPDEIGARLGGDEFAVVHPLSPGGSLDAFEQRILRIFDEPMAVAGYQGRIGGSLGLAIYPRDATDAESLLNNADLAMYRAKAEKSRAVCVYERKMDESVRARRRLAADLEAAIAEGALEVHYQPQISLMDGSTTGYEALARWRHPDLGPISPEEFIALAEEHGLIERLGELILRIACAEAASWEPAVNVAVNVSAWQLRRPDFDARVSKILADVRFPAARLEVELTESALIRDPKQALATLARLRALGVSIALDDFGTGYSSLATLRTFKFDKIKLDRSFVGEIETNTEARALLRAALALGQALDIPLLAEGVETRGQFDLLRYEGCPEAQGYLIGRPAPLRALMAEGRLKSAFAIGARNLPRAEAA